MHTQLQSLQPIGLCVSKKVCADLIDQLQVASHAPQRLLALAGLPQEDGEVIGAGHQALRLPAAGRLIALQGSLQTRNGSQPSDTA